VPSTIQDAEVAIASGKGGTGKTTLATNLAAVLAEEGWRVTYADCDVEEPNGHLFMEPCLRPPEAVVLPLPIVDSSACDGCGECAEICQFGAIACLGDRARVFPDLCHGCGGCTLVCPQDAISEEPREIGVVEEGTSGGLRFVQGRLAIGQPMSPPVIREVKRRLPSTGLRIVDAPPGTACPAVQAVRGADLVLLVTEPTPFGLNDLRLAVETLRAMDLPFHVVVNRCDIGDEGVRQYCLCEEISVVLEIPDDRRVAEAYSRGLLAASAVPGYRSRLLNLVARLDEDPIL